MATPKRSFGYRFAPKKGATPDEIMCVLMVVLKLIQNNALLCEGPRSEIEELPVRLKRHFEREDM